MLFNSASIHRIESQCSAASGTQFILLTPGDFEGGPDKYAILGLCFIMYFEQLRI